MLCGDGGPRYAGDCNWRSLWRRGEGGLLPSVCIFASVKALANIDRVDTCTGLLPEQKPRYVMGVVGHLENRGVQG